MLLSLHCIDLFSCKAASVFAINLLTYLLTYSFDVNVVFTTPYKYAYLLASLLTYLLESMMLTLVL